MLYENTTISNLRKNSKTKSNIQNLNYNSSQRSDEFEKNTHNFSSNNTKTLNLKKHNNIRLSLQESFTYNSTEFSNTSKENTPKTQSSNFKKSSLINIGKKSELENSKDHLLTLKKKSIKSRFSKYSTKTMLKEIWNSIKNSNSDFCSNKSNLQKLDLPLVTFNFYVLFYLKNYFILVYGNALC